MPQNDNTNKRSKKQKRRRQPVKQQIISKRENQKLRITHCRNQNHGPTQNKNYGAEIFKLQMGKTAAQEGIE